MNGICTSKTRLDGKVALITGGTTGMGLEIAKDFAKRGAKVIIACPFEKEGAEALEDIDKNCENHKVQFKLLDLGSFASTRRFAADILKSEERLDILVNNAGGVFRWVTKDGFEGTIHVNYLGHFLLTMLLLPLLKKTAPSRIVIVASIMHWFGYINYNNFHVVDKWLFTQQYSNSKLCLVKFTKELSRRLAGTGVTVNSLHPGTVGTRIFCHAIGGPIGTITMWLASIIFKSVKEGAQTAIYLSVDPEVSEKSGIYFEDCKESRESWFARNDKQAIELWEKTKIMVQLSDEEVIV